MRDILGDHVAFCDDLFGRLDEAGIDVNGHALSHLAFRTANEDEYVELREAIEARSIANVENRWNGRPISKLLLREPLELGGGRTVDLVELIPPPHQRDWPLGLEHLGVVIGETFEAFCDRHEPLLTGRQDQGPFCQPRFVTFPNDRTVKFYRHSLQTVVELEGRSFDGFRHA